MALDKFEREKKRLWKAYLQYQMEWEELQIRLNNLEIERQRYYK